jgi:hypothetical protein
MFQKHNHLLTPHGYGPHRLVVRTSRCGRDNPGLTPGAVIIPRLPLTHIAQPQWAPERVGNIISDCGRGGHFNPLSMPFLRKRL